MLNFAAARIRHKLVPPLPTLAPQGHTSRLLNGPSDAFKVLRERSGTWFDPEMVDAFAALGEDALPPEKVFEITPRDVPHVRDINQIASVAQRS